MSTKTFTVKKVELVGCERTSSSFFTSEVDALVQRSRNIEELANNLEASRARMHGMNLFDNLNAKLHVGPKKNGGQDVTIKFEAQEKGVPFLNMQSFVKAGSTAGSDMGFELQGALRNTTGHGEILSVSSQKTETGSMEFISSLSVPNVSPDRGQGTLSYKITEDTRVAHFTGFRQHSHALQGEYISRNGKHNLAIEYALRDEVPVARNVGVGLLAKLIPSDFIPNKKGASGDAASVTPLVASGQEAVLNTATSSLKRSVRHLFTILDSRDSASTPTTGDMMQTSLELGSYYAGASSKYADAIIKGELNVQSHRSFGPALYGQSAGVIASWCGSVGLLVPLIKRTSTSPSIIRLSDRFHAGGPMSLRGFDVCGVGPRAVATATSIGNSSSNSSSHASTPVIVEEGTDHAALGGSTKASSLLMLSVPLPLPSLAAMQPRGFVFMNAGSIGNGRIIRNASSVDDTAAIPPFWGYMRASVGTGVSISIANVLRLEATYAVPVRKAAHDQVKNFQLGVSLTVS